MGLLCAVAGYFNRANCGVDNLRELCYYGDAY